MARTRQTARKSTGGKAPRFWHGQERILWIPCQRWPEWLQQHEEKLLRLLGSADGLNYVCAGRRVGSAEAAAFVTIWDTAGQLAKFEQSTSFSELLSELGVGDTEQVQRFRNDDRSSSQSVLRGKVSIGVISILSDEKYFYETEKHKRILWNAFDGHISCAKKGIRRPPNLNRIRLTWCPSSHGSLLYGFFRWLSGDSEVFTTKSSDGYKAWLNTILNGFPTGTTAELQNWEFFRPAHGADIGNNDVEEELCLPILANLSPTEDEGTSHWREYRFNRLLAETLKETGSIVAGKCSSASIGQVLSSPYLLVLILANLPQKDLLLNQRVSQMWHSVIASTQQIQEKLFFRPRNKSLWRTAHGEYNPILYERFPGFFKEPESDIPSLGPWSDSHWFRTSTWRRPQLESTYRIVDASWRRMIPCNPAPTEYQFIYYHTSWGHDSSWRLKTLSIDHTILSGTSQYLTFGCLHDVLERIWFQGRYFLPPNSISIYFGDLDPYAAHSSGEESEDISFGFPRLFANKCQKHFPTKLFEGATKVLVELRHGVGCSGRSSRASHLDPEQFRIETPRKPEWDVELS